MIEILLEPSLTKVRCHCLCTLRHLQGDLKTDATSFACPRF